MEANGNDIFICSGTMNFFQSTGILGLEIRNTAAGIIYGYIEGAVLS